MEPRTLIVRDRDGQERVLLDLVEFQALLDAGHRPGPVQVELGAIVHRLAKVLDEKPDELLDLDAFLQDYDAAHRRD